MNDTGAVAQLAQSIGGVALVLPRIVACFLMIPLMSSETVPALVRNSFYVSLAIMIYPLSVAGSAATPAPGADWLLLLGKEFLLGLLIGFSFGLVFWALGAAGSVLDTAIGASMASQYDPLQSQQTSLLGSFLTHLGTWLFMISGAFLILLDLLIGSYRIWPVGTLLPPLHGNGAWFFADQFQYLMTAVLAIAAPALLVMALVDLGLGLVNRYAQQLNVFSLTMPIKAWMAQWLLLLSLGAIVEVVLRKVYDNRGLLLVLRRLFG